MPAPSFVQQEHKRIERASAGHYSEKLVRRSQVTRVTVIMNRCRCV